jgi:hypothetical protein
MPTIKLTETYLSSSIIVMPTVNFENFDKNLSAYWNLPDLIDQTLAVDPIDENGLRKHPEYSFVSIEQFMTVACIHMMIKTIPWNLVTF